MSGRSAADKKRDRDRRAQQNLRDKKLRHTAKLEAQVAHCEQYHNETGVENLLGVIESLRKQNETLVARQRALRSVVSSWDEKPDETGPSNSSIFQDTNNDQCGQTKSFAQTVFTPEGSEILNNRMGNLPCPIVISTSSASLPPTPRAPHQTDINSPWNKLPLCSDNPVSAHTVSIPWLAYPELIIQSPDTPESPLDILYGSKTNVLANMIHTTIERRPVRDPERLAMGWLMYHFSKWIIEPSPKTFARLPPFLHPLQEQLEIEHPLVISCIPYPKLRLNLIHQWPLYEKIRDDLFGLMSCSIKIRWPWGVKILDRDEANEIRIKPAFYETFMKEEGWGIMQEFMDKHPNLMAGIDASSLVFNMI